MSADAEVKTIIAEELARVQAKNPSYSLRSYAKKLGISPAALSEIMRGRRPLTRKAARKILERLCVHPQKAEKLLAKTDHVDQKEFTKINMDYFNVISDWYYLAILSLAETEGFCDEPEWVAERLNIRKRDAKSAFARLERLGLMERREGGLCPTGLQYETSQGIANPAIRKNHFQNLELARKSLEGDPLDERDFSAITMVVDPERLPEAKKRLKEFRREFCSHMESGRKREVYRLCLQFFPLSKSKKEKT